MYGYRYPLPGDVRFMGFRQMASEIPAWQQLIEQNVKLTNEIASLVRENHRLLTLLYTRQYGTYPPRQR